MKYIEDIAIDYRDGFYKNKMNYPDYKKYRDDHIFDEEKSVKWNREEATRQNEQTVKLREEHARENSRLSNLLTDDMVKAIMYEYKLNQKQAEKIYSYAYSERHSSMNEVFFFAEEISELYVTLVKMKDE